MGWRGGHRNYLVILEILRKKFQDFKVKVITPFMGGQLYWKNIWTPTFRRDPKWKPKKRDGDVWEEMMGSWDFQWHRKRISNEDRAFWWGDGTSWNDVSPYEYSVTPCPLVESSRKHSVPALIHPFHFAPTKTKRYCIMHDDKDVSVQGHCVTGDD